MSYRLGLLDKSVIPDGASAERGAGASPGRHGERGPGRGDRHVAGGRHDQVRGRDDLAGRREHEPGLRLGGRTREAPRRHADRSAEPGGGSPGGACAGGERATRRQARTGRGSRRGSGDGSCRGAEHKRCGSEERERPPRHAWSMEPQSDPRRMAHRPRERGSRLRRGFYLRSRSGCVPLVFRVGALVRTALRQGRPGGRY